MRIYVTTDVVGGVWDYTATLAEGLTAAGHDVRLAIIGEPPEDRLAGLPGRVETVSGSFRLEWMTGAETDVVRAGEWLAEDARRWGADVVHLNQMAYAVHDFGAPTLVVAHSDVLSWFSETLDVEAPPEWRAYTEWVREGIRAADVVVAPSLYQSGLIGRHYGRAADHVIHNGVTAPAGAPAPRGRPLAVSAGRAWDPAKGMEVLDSAAARLRGSHAGVHLFGDTIGPAGERFAPRALHAHGRATRGVLDRWLSRATLYVAPSIYEPFGLAPLEAAFRGAALLLSDIPSFRELWDGCAVFFTPGDAAALARRLDELLPDLDRCAELAAAARERALSRYTAERFTAGYLALYADMRSRLEIRTCA